MKINNADIFDICLWLLVFVVVIASVSHWINKEPEIKVRIVDGCEYLVMDNAITHKANCRNH